MSTLLSGVDKQRLIRDMESTRARTFQLLEMVSEENRCLRVHDFYSPFGWHVGHVALVEEHWILVRALGREPENPDLSFLFANVPENPKDNRVHLPSREETIKWLCRVREKVLRAIEDADFASSEPLLNDAYCVRFALQHEHQHQETMVELMQLIGGQDPPRLCARATETLGPFPAKQMLRMEGGEFLMGSNDAHAYDNEKPRHIETVKPYFLSSLPVTAGELWAFMDAGGYENKQLWSEQGWDWRQRENTVAPEYWRFWDGAWHYQTPLGLREIRAVEPAASLGWYEAEAVAKWAGKRLPTEPEWEFAAAFDPSAATQRKYPWGDEQPHSERANFGIGSWGVRPAGALPRGASALGFLDMAGQVWEWTSTPFRPYAGFRPYPYEGYSFEHMDGQHRVCKGGSWASQAEILRCTFRNWYVPTYRQGLLGLRLAADA